MATSSRDSREITPKESRRDLTEKQRVIVDAIAEHPDGNDTEIAREASEKLDGDTVSRSYVPNVREKQAHLIEERREQLDNQRYQGEERTEGEPFPELEKPREWQTFAERPYDDSGEDDADTDDAEDTPEEKPREDAHTPAEKTVDLAVDRCEVLGLLDGDVPASLQGKVIDALFERAFAE